MQIHGNHEPFQPVSLTSTYGSGVNSEYSRKKSNPLCKIFLIDFVHNFRAGSKL